MITQPTTNQKATIRISPSTIVKETKKQKKEMSSLKKNRPGLVYERPEIQPFRLAVKNCEDELIECDEQKGTSSFRMKGGNDMGYHNMSGGVMKDIPERADFSDSDEDMTDSCWLSDSDSKRRIRKLGIQYQSH